MFYDAYLLVILKTKNAYWRLVDCLKIEVEWPGGVRVTVMSRSDGRETYIAGGRVYVCLRATHCVHLHGGCLMDTVRQWELNPY